MKSPLALTGTSELLEQLSAFVPDELINHLVPLHRGRGRRITFSPAQLFRVHLLALLTPARSFNLLVRLLSEQRSWRRFAHLSHRHHVPDVWMLHQFRAAIGVGGLREVNRHLLRPLLESQWVRTQAVAIIDSTDLPAATHGHKKRLTALIRLPERLWVRGRSRAGRVGGSSVTRSTHCACGSTVMRRACSLCP
jgi:hypothetical protein